MYNIKTQLQLFNTIVKSVLLYFSSVWSLNYIEDLEKFQTQFLRKLMNVTNLVPGFLLRLETGCESIKIPIFKALSDLFTKYYV